MPGLPNGFSIGQRIRHLRVDSVAETPVDMQTHSLCELLNLIEAGGLPGLVSSISMSRAGDIKVTMNLDCQHDVFLQ
jgi:hypothetical protein